MAIQKCPSGHTTILSCFTSISRSCVLDHSFFFDKVNVWPQGRNAGEEVLDMIESCSMLNCTRGYNAGVILISHDKYHLSLV